MIPLSLAVVSTWTVILLAKSRKLTGGKGTIPLHLSISFSCARLDSRGGFSYEHEHAGGKGKGKGVIATVVFQLE